MNTRPDRAEPADLDGEGPTPALAALARERLPARDLWPGIEARLPPRRRRAARWPYALAASVCVASLAGLLLRSPDAPEATEPVQLASVQTDGAGIAADPGPAPWGSSHEGQSERLPRAMRTLRSESSDGPQDLQGMPDSGLVTVGYRPSGRLSAHAVRTGGHQRTLMRANLKLISQAERELRRALREDPESESLRDLLSAAQSQRDSLQSLITTEHD